ncbi:LCP family protein [Floricoccus penangensis]|uniref:LCP family protein n=1 Tax=Floricoccus penangensis TaxID=1859475 RepID=UPI00203E66CD|nr:LCP family protein [Floricoccus penangensis]URZ86724.1 LCP family protein [Floricoccus penangensis]
MEQKFKRRKDYLEKNFKYLTANEKIELERLKRLEAKELENQGNKTEELHKYDRRGNAQSNIRKTISKSEPKYEETSNTETNYDEDISVDDKDLENEKIPKEKKSKKPKKKKSFLRRLRNFLIIVLVLIIGFFAYGYFRVKNLPTANFSVEKFNGKKAKNGATNILILGTDQRDYQTTDDARSDSMMMLQIGGPDKKVKIVSFMRDTLVEIPGFSYEGYPDSKLNLAYNLGEQDNHKGADLTRETIKKNFGIDAEYYAMVNFSSFAEVIDSLFPAGVKIDAQFSTVDGEKVKQVEVPDDLRYGPNNLDPKQTIKVGKQRMDGRTLLNYARFRKDDEGDFGRTKRQQQVLEAIISQAKNPATLFTGPSAIGTIKALTSTNVPNTTVITKGIPAILNASKGIESYTVPELGDWQDVEDQYGGAALLVDFDKYKAKLKDTFGE